MAKKRQVFNKATGNFQDAAPQSMGVEGVVKSIQNEMARGIQKMKEKQDAAAKILRRD